MSLAVSMIRCEPRTIALLLAIYCIWDDVITTLGIYRIRIARNLHQHLALFDIPATQGAWCVHMPDFSIILLTSYDTFLCISTQYAHLISRKRFMLSNSMEKRKSFTVCSLVPAEVLGLFQHFWSVDARLIRV